MYTLDYAKYAKISREVCANSCVLLKNEQALPIKKDETVSIFGRSQIETYHCGTGSGGMVNTPYVVNVVDGLKSKRKINDELLETYKTYIFENPFDFGNGWASEPWSQIELALDDEMVLAASKKSDIAIYVIGRLAGEDRDLTEDEGSYYLSSTEKNNVSLICKHFKRSVILLNVGNVIDMTAFDDAAAIVYAWHGGAESGNGYADVLCGDMNFSGSMTDTVCKLLETNFMNKNFGNSVENCYEEDIFVGYRYFETFAKNEVLYPFGFGLSYTTFDITNVEFKKERAEFVFLVDVKNTGDVAGKKSVQIYLEAPNGELGKADRVLMGFAKTKMIDPLETQTVEISFTEDYMASYDDFNSYFMIEEGEYIFHIGFDVRNTPKTFEMIYEKDKITFECIKALAPDKAFKRITAHIYNNKKQIVYKKTPEKDYSVAERMAVKGTLDKTHFNYPYSYVLNGTISPEQFVCDLSDQDLICLTRGEGMCSPKVTPGTAGSFGGVTESLALRKIPIACCADGPSGIRMDSGQMAFSLPNGTAIASTFDTALITELFEFLGLELLKNGIDTILGPGLNIHRNPLCGRNFEYFSEDPVLTGKMAVAQLKGLHKYGVTGTIKHFACNNQEYERHNSNSVVSERALREIYIKGFEIAIKEVRAFCIMTSYNLINGMHCSSNYDLTTTILRKDYGFTGVVMTDWWAYMNYDENDISSKENTTAMILAQNDLHMVSTSSFDNSSNDNSQAMLESKRLSRSDLIVAGKNIINTLLKMPCSKPKMEVEEINKPVAKFTNCENIGDFNVDSNETLNTKNIKCLKSSRNIFTISTKDRGRFKIVFDLETNAVEFSQIPMTIFLNGELLKTITLKGISSVIEEVYFNIEADSKAYIDLFFGESGMKINTINITKL